MSLPDYKFAVGDSVKLLKMTQDASIPTVVTGLPDMQELSISDIGTYLTWFKKAANLIFQKTRPDGYVIFIQTDRKVGGEWIDKSYWLTDCAYNNNWRLMWHKLCLNRPVGSANLHRPTYSHILCYSVNGRPGNGLADAISTKASDRLYDNATPMVALELVMSFLEGKIPRSKKYSSQDVIHPNRSGYQIVDPFVGQGSVVYMALLHNYSAFGIDIDPNQIALAEELIRSIQ